MNNLSLLTYTHSNVSDLHPAYFGRLEKYFPDMKNSFVMCDKKIDYVNCIIYDDLQNHGIQMVNALEKIPTDYVIYAQEDYILFDYVNTNEINKLVQYMEADINIPFIRLIYSGVGNHTKNYNDDLGYLDSNWEYYFSTQITIWRKDILIKMYKNANPIKLTDTEVHKVQYLRDISTNGLFYLKKGKAIGGHFNSPIYPYICTGVVKGKWNYSEYEKELNDVFQEYNIIPFERGIV